MKAQVVLPGGCTSVARRVFDAEILIDAQLDELIRDTTPEAVDACPDPVVSAD